MSNTRYNEEMRLQTVKQVLKGDKSAAKIAKELGINQNTVSRWVQEYRKHCLGDTTVFLLPLTKRRVKRQNLFCHFRADRSTMA